MKIFITGCLGYVSRSLCELYTNSEHEVIGIDSNFIQDQVDWLTKNNIKFYKRDLFDIADLLDGSDIIYHLAGITDVNLTPSQATKEKDDLITRIGTEGTRYIIENSPLNSKLVFASTQVVYDGLTEEKLNITEDFPPRPLVSYSKSKWQSELDLFDSDRNFIIARFASVYGYNNGNVRWKILPNLFSKMTGQNQDLKVFGPNNYKPLVGVGDLAKCLDFLANSEYSREIFHCVNENLRVIDIARICEEFNPKININIVNEETPNKGYTLSNEKLLKSG
ncbi:MAG: NAD(P)-dependent oxidoreductase, partial [Nanoarchaeota archaeon]